MIRSIRTIRKKLFYVTFGLFLCSAIPSYTQPAQAQAQSNGCGPEGFGLLIPDGPFTEPCNQHDLCYGDGSTPQSTCDSRFKQDMYQVCEKKSFILKIGCKAAANMYYNVVANSGETYISLDGQTISGKIVSVSARRIDAWIGDDEFEACVTFKNDGTINTEFDLQLFDEKGKLIDTEPDTYEINVPVGGTNKECVGTDGIYASISDLGKKYKITLRVDAPQEKLGANLVNDFTVVDLYHGQTP